MDKKLEKMLLSEFYSKKLSLKNKFVLSAVPTGIVGSDIPTDNNIQFYGDRAKSVGLIIAGAINIAHETAPNFNGMPELETPEQILSWQNITDEVHKQESKIIAQLWHSGGYRKLCMKDNVNVTTPSGVIAGIAVGEPVSEQGIKEIISCFSQAAINAKKAGFDGIEIHGGHSGLVHNFLSQDTNCRTDSYGQNRTTFAQEIVSACRQAVGEKFPILFRLSQFQMYDFKAKLGETPEELIDVIRPLAKAGVDIFDCSALDFRDDAFRNVEGTLATWVKKIANKPVITTGSIGSTIPFSEDMTTIVQALIRSPDFLNQFSAKTAEVRYQEELLGKLEEKEVDLIGVGRPILLDSQWVEKVTGKVR
ncbi:12-oxophytodienoate reductase [Bacilli bacterium]|nr:12-oxophytodienoate reductase [Bacilli bacterium]GHU45041.1 12-oxophytodienoate reductase [Bacilli bacterium]